MNKYLAKQGDSFDKICFKEYKTLQKDVYAAFLRANYKLLDKEFLEGGEVVNLPKIEVKKEVSKVKQLWD